MKKIFLIIVATILLASCSTTYHLYDDVYYTVRVSAKNKPINVIHHEPITLHPITPVYTPVFSRSIYTPIYVDWYVQDFMWLNRHWYMFNYPFRYHTYYSIYDWRFNHHRPVWYNYPMRINNYSWYYYNNNNRTNIINAPRQSIGTTNINTNRTRPAPTSARPLDDKVIQRSAPTNTRRALPTNEQERIYRRPESTPDVLRSPTRQNTTPSERRSTNTVTPERRTTQPSRVTTPIQQPRNTNVVPPSRNTTEPSRSSSPSSATPTQRTTPSRNTSTRSVTPTQRQSSSPQRSSSPSRRN